MPLSSCSLCVLLTVAELLSARGALPHECIVTYLPCVLLASFQKHLAASTRLAQGSFCGRTDWLQRHSDDRANLADAAGAASVTAPRTKCPSYGTSN